MPRGDVLRAGVAQLVEHVTRNDGVTGSIPVTSSIPGWAGPNPRPLAMKIDRRAARPSRGGRGEARDASPELPGPIRDVELYPIATKEH